MTLARRTFLISSLATIAATPNLAGGSQTFDYTPGLVKKALSEGKTVLVDYAADWCSTCARQERVIGQLRSKNPAYSDRIMFVRVDWDEFRRADITTSRNIPRRSTLILLKGNKELGRIVAGTSTSQIKALLDKGLAASS